MNKFILSCFCLFSLFLHSQDQVDGYTTSEEQNELKINGLFLILGAIEVDYQYLLNDESALGIDVLFAFDDETIDVNYYFSPYYRQYFGKKYATGFFVEAFGMLNSVDDYIYDSYHDESTNTYYSYSTYDDNVVDFALGIGTGVKLITKRGFIVEIDLGIGRNLFKNERDFTIIGKGGINLDYRF
ncbi:MAG: DUF3575 domain-containing protein [Maribacter dokdonensis]|uniref:DUF3575 domain-containing protein n=1 Tax=Maribacter dokdonensis TaxID=320912 RepID=UPI00329736DD